VRLTVAGDLEIEIGDRELLLIEAEENLLEYIEAEVVDGVLEIRQLGNLILSPKGPIRYYVTTRELDRVESAAGGHVRLPLIAAEHFQLQHRGSGDVHAIGMDGGTLSVHSSGSGRVMLDHISALRCRFTLSGSGDVKVQHLVGLSNTAQLTGSGDLMISEGRVVQQQAIVSGSGDYKGKGLRTSATDVMVSGSGSAVIYAQDQLVATITGRGGIRYLGNPQVAKNISGTGVLTSID
jgi:hypothetical protein